MIYEYRRYEVSPNRMGDLNSRFEKVTLPLWREKFGIDAVGFWTGEIGVSNILHYLLRWKDMGEREAIWTRWAADPEWLARRAESEANGTLVPRFHNELWRPTSYSELK